MLTPWPAGQTQKPNRASRVPEGLCQNAGQEGTDFMGAYTQEKYQTQAFSAGRALMRQGASSGGAPSSARRAAATVLNAPRAGSQPHAGTACTVTAHPGARALASPRQRRQVPIDRGKRLPEYSCIGRQATAGPCYKLLPKLLTSINEGNK